MNTDQLFEALPRVIESESEEYTFYLIRSTDGVWVGYQSDIFARIVHVLGGCSMWNM